MCPSIQRPVAKLRRRIQQARKFFLLFLLRLCPLFARMMDGGEMTATNLPESPNRKPATDPQGDKEKAARKGPGPELSPEKRVAVDKEHCRRRVTKKAAPSRSLLVYGVAVPAKETLARTNSGKPIWRQHRPVSLTVMTIPYGPGYL